MTGDVDAAELGVTMCHEHCTLDLRALFTGDGERPVREVLGELARWPLSTTRANLVLDEPDVVLRELGDYRDAGGTTIVEVTPRGVGRDVEALRGLALESGVRIVAGTGWYVEATHPPEVARLSVDELAAVLVADVRDGAGVIGELGVSCFPLAAAEEKVLRAGARAALATGVAVTLHLDPLEPRPAMAALDVLADEGLAPERIVAGHMDLVEDLDHHLGVAARGVFVAYDNLGEEGYAEEIAPGFTWGRDEWRLRFVQRLLDAGHGAQLLFSQDVAMKINQRAYGGRGYSHVLRNVVPELERLGVERRALDAILVDNPARAFVCSSG